MRVAVLHGYSAENLGDGLLVRETLDLIREALGEVEITVAASQPWTFEDLPVRVVGSGITRRGVDWDYVRLLWSLKDFDVIVGVGGGYLRFGRPTEAIKTLVVHVPQLLCAALSRVPSIYLPQSIGPARFGTRWPVGRLLARVSVVALRDDRSMSEFAIARPIRFPDLAAMGSSGISPSEERPDQKPVLSVRHIRGKLPEPVRELANRMERFDSYVQSTTGANDDRPATAEIAHERIVSSKELVGAKPSSSRVVIAMRLHAALMALQAGHYVIHLAYERKGFGAFGDLGLSQYVVNANDFDVEHILALTDRLLTDESARAAYRADVGQTSELREQARARLVEELRKLTSQGFTAVTR